MNARAQVATGKIRPLLPRPFSVIGLTAAYAAFAGFWFWGLGSLVRIVMTDSQARGRWLAALDGSFVVLSTIGALVGLRYLQNRIRRECSEAAQQEAWYQRTFEQTGIGLAHATPAGRVLRVSDQFCAIVRHTRDELLNLDLPVVIHPEDRDSFSRRLRELAEGESGSAAIQLRAARGEMGPAWVRLTVSLLHDRSGRPDHFVVVAEDITARRYAEDALVESESRFRTLIEQSITGVYLVVDGIYNYVNRRLAQMYGYAPEELIGKVRMIDLVAESDRDRVQEQIRQRLFGEVTSSHYTVHGLRKDGTIIVVEVHGRVLMHGGRPALMGTLLDITERERAQEGLRQSEEQLRLLIRNVRDCAIFTLDPLGRVTSWNEGAERLTGYSPDMIVGKPFHRLLSRDAVNAGHSQRLLEQSIAGWSVSEEGWVVRRDGSLFWGSLVIDALRDADGRLVTLTVLTRDRSEQRSAAESLQRTRQRHRALVARILSSPDRELAPLSGNEGREVSSSLERALRAEVHRFQEVTGLVCDLETPLEVHDVPAKTADALVRTLREGLTDAFAFTRATRVAIRLVRETGAVVVVLRYVDADETHPDPGDAAGPVDTLEPLLPKATANSPRSGQDASQDPTEITLRVPLA